MARKSKCFKFQDRAVWFRSQLFNHSGSRHDAIVHLRVDYLRKGDQPIVTSMDRLARSLVDLYTIIEDLVGRGVSVRFLREGQTYSAKADPIAKLMLGLMGSVAEFERSIIKERQAEGIARAKARSITKVGRRCSPTLRSFKHDSG